MTRTTKKKTTKKKVKAERPAPPPSIPRGRRAIAIAVVATLGLLAADLGSKQWAEENLSQESLGDPGPACEPDSDGRITYQRHPIEPHVLVDDYFELRYAENCGAAFGIMRSGSFRVVFVIAAVLASVALFFMFVKGRGGTLFAWSVPMIVSGALGNLVDRMRYGYVVDFIKFDVPDLFSYPTFNIADCGITIGVLLLVIDGFREGRELKKQSKASAASKDD